jgi:C4-dicarboxylate transporter DctQ subunit
MTEKLINTFEEGVIALLLVAMTLLVFVEVILRFGFNTGVMWMEEITLLLSAWMVLFGASYGIRVGAHIGVDALVRHVRPSLRRIYGIIAVSLSMVYCGLIAYGAWVYLVKIRRIGIELEDLPWPKWIAHSILLIGMVLLALRLGQLLLQIFRGQTSGFTMADEASKALEDIKIETEARS